VTFARQVDLENAIFLFDLRSTTLLKFVQDRAEKYECEAENEEKRCDHIREDPNVWILNGREEIDREKKNKSKERCSSQQHASPTDPVLEMTPERLALCRSYTLKHRYNYLAVPKKIERCRFEMRIDSADLSRSCHAQVLRIELEGSKTVSVPGNCCVL